MRALNKLLSVVGSVLLCASAAWAQDEWIVEVGKVNINPKVVVGAGALWDAASDRLLALYYWPELMLAQCRGGQCTSELVDADFSPVLAYLLRDAVGLLALYNATDGIRLARREGATWTPRAAPLAQPCTDLVTATQKTADSVGLLCRDASDGLWHQWQESGTWQAEAVPVEEEDIFVEQALAYASDGRPHIVKHQRASSVYGYYVYHQWRDELGAWQQETVEENPDAGYCISVHIQADKEGDLWLAIDHGAQYLTSPWRILFKQGTGGWSEQDTVGVADSYAAMSSGNLIAKPSGGIGFAYFLTWDYEDEYTYSWYCVRSTDADDNDVSGGGCFA